MKAPFRRRILARHVSCCSELLAFLSRMLPIVLGFIFLVTVNGDAAGQSKKTAKASKAAQAKNSPQESVVPSLEPKAMEILKAACDKLAAARTMSFTAVTSYENPSRIGPALVYTTKSEVTLKRPDKLRVITPADGPAQEFYYDGKKMVAVSPSEKLFAEASAPPTIDAALKAAYDAGAIYFPFTDLIVTDPFKGVTEGLTHAFYIGQSEIIGGTKTDMIAYVNDEVFVQAWVGAEDKLPRMLRGVYRRDALRLRHQVELSNWKLDAEVPAETFTARIPEGALPIAFARPDPQLPAGAPPREKPVVKAKQTTKEKSKAKATTK